MPEHLNGATGTMEGYLACPMEVCEVFLDIRLLSQDTIV